MSSLSPRLETGRAVGVVEVDLLQDRARLIKKLSCLGGYFTGRVCCLLIVLSSLAQTEHISVAPTNMLLKASLEAGAKRVMIFFIVV